MTRTLVYGYEVRDDITAGRSYTVTMPHNMSAKRFGDVVELVKGIGERPGSSAEFDGTAWTVAIAEDGKGALADLQLAEAKYGATVELIEEPQMTAATDPADYQDRDLDLLTMPDTFTEEMRDYARDYAVAEAKAALADLEAEAPHTWAHTGETVTIADGSQWYAIQAGRLSAAVGHLLAVIEAAK